ncbi:hypothetical protein AIOL_004016 [Candidatus Rhodobacter oscarellae]|uniref:Uncharacterized protein n=2 Tax=Candidatus Rhodobacter oscarellae TaxID=1675527 RepID=A0A0J9E8G1_9RHOB|nr:hypothetical protein AIOL_004016 [Candidatus Rhodobacter lobularis]
MSELAAAIRDRDLAELAAKQAHRRGAELARLDLMEQAEAERQVALSDVSYRRDFESPRHVWHASRIRALSFEEARSAALLEMQRKVTAKSVGRAAVLERLVQKDLKAKRRE